ncbi:RbsD/FucU family protein [Paenibacillus sp.]|uniref:RbsD/FucU family protein n=1 Tax=Paenibacillus sp. TaxID=58172 RepID=UPI002D2C9835|nr:RbsD/FucU domain-containing protein [Paenibacillus sp.]HZG57427.1 RbsD/FucU domain-containing protein [Paenibacillus sp.]
MLIGIPSLLSPDFLKMLMEMGHGDELVLADGNFPAASHAQRLIRCDGHGIPEVLDAVVRFFPLDQYVERPVALMATGPEHPSEPPVWSTYRGIVRERSGSDAGFELVERFAFYERAKRAYAIVATSESALYGNVILKKGVIKA